jgi:hypothetical protein
VGLERQGDRLQPPKGAGLGMGPGGLLA